MWRISWCRRWPIWNVDDDTRRGLRMLRRKLVQQRGAGTPWLARDAADVLATFDMTAWISVLGLLDECPMLPAALTAMLERRTTPVSPTAFEFISTTAQSVTFASSCDTGHRVVALSARAPHRTADGDAGTKIKAARLRVESPAMARFVSRTFLPTKSASAFV